MGCAGAGSHPQGHLSASWSPCTQRGTGAIVNRFRGEACQPCPMRHLCTSATKDGRQLTVRPRPLPQALDQARADQPPAPGRTNAGDRGTEQFGHLHSSARCPPGCWTDRG
ncbi:transposase [Nonomuraea sp. NPDC049480]|uniref:transposase n=1 Tax=Nonomuraea sp. NPDC049480 TaxID=3364353 RepID=UPI0037AF40C3